MTRPHPVEGKARTRKPETVLREIACDLRHIFADVEAGLMPLEIEHQDLRALLAELRRSLRYTKGKRCPGR